MATWMRNFRLLIQVLNQYKSMKTLIRNSSHYNRGRVSISTIKHYCCKSPKDYAKELYSAKDDMELIVQKPEVGNICDENKTEENPCEKEKEETNDCETPKVTKKNEENYCSSDEEVEMLCTKTLRNQGLFLISPGVVEMMDTDMPQLGPNDCLVQIETVLFSSIDKILFTFGDYRGKKLADPIIMGSQGCGRVIGIGSNVDPEAFSEDELVAIEPAFPCYNCHYCINRKTHLCPKQRILGTPGQHGLFQRYVAIPHTCLFSIPSFMTKEEASMIVSLAVAIRCNRRAGITVGVRPLIVGSNATAVLCALVAQSIQASRVSLMGTSESNIVKADELGVNNTFILSEDDSTRVIALNILDTIGQPDVLVDCTPYKNRIFLLASKILNDYGKFVLVGYKPEACDVPMHELMNKHINVKPVVRSRNDFPEAIDMAGKREDGIDLRDFVTHRYSFEDFEEALLVTMNMPKYNSYKVALHFDPSEINP